MREIILDTETTGLSIKGGDRIIEIACVEMINRICTGNDLHYYVKCDKDSSPEALKIHGLTREFLSDKPIFKDIANEFINFIDKANLVIHNASFDIKFINNELEILGLKKISNPIIDTLLLARQKFPGSSVSLDALCKKLNIDNSSRVKHGALIDCHLLAEVYIELMGGKQTSFDLSIDSVKTHQDNNIIFPSRSFPISQKESEEHLKLIEKIPDSIWNKTNQ